MKRKKVLKKKRIKIMILIYFESIFKLYLILSNAHAEYFFNRLLSTITNSTVSPSCKIIFESLTSLK